MITVQRQAFSMMAGVYEFEARREGKDKKAVALLRLIRDGELLQTVQYRGYQAYGLALHHGLAWLKESSHESSTPETMTSATRFPG
jgi:hypothetical protein